LFLVERRHHAGKRVAGIEAVVAEKPEASATEVVGSRLGHGVNDRSTDAAMLGVEPVGQHLELGDVLLAVTLVRPAAALVGDVDTIDVVLGHVAAGGASLNVSRIAARAWDQRHEIEPVAAVQRQRFDLRGVDAAGNARLLDVNERCFARDRDVFLDARQLERERQIGRFTHGETDVLLGEGREATQLDANVVAADLQRRHHEGPSLRADGSSRHAGFDMGQSHRGAGQRGAAFVDDPATKLRDSSLGRQRRGRCRKRHASEYGQPHAPVQTSHRILLVVPPIRRKEAAFRRAKGTIPRGDVRAISVLRA
jgi:hypothetical protein